MASVTICNGHYLNGFVIVIRMEGHKDADKLSQAAMAD